MPGVVGDEGIWFKLHCRYAHIACTCRVCMLCWIFIHGAYVCTDCCMLSWLFAAAITNSSLQYGSNALNPMLTSHTHYMHTANPL